MKTFRPLQERPVIAANTSLQISAVCVQKLQPFKAAWLSLLPGLGQIYLGQWRKGILFLLVFVTNACTFAGSLFANDLQRLLNGWALLWHRELNLEDLRWLQELHSPNPFLIIYGLLIASFVAFAVKDAYDQACLSGRMPYQTRFFFGLAEATSGSYLFHFIALCSGLTIMLFLARVKEPIEQVTDIILMPPPPPAPSAAPAKAKNLPRQSKPVEKIVAKPPLAKIPAVEPNPLPVVPLETQAPANLLPELGNGSTGGTAAGAGNGFGEGEEVDLGPYLAELQKRIKKAWFPPRGNESKRITVRFKIHQDGEVTGVKLEKSSGFSMADDAALEAVEKASPVPPLPPGTDPVVTIKFTFDYNVFNGGQNAAWNDIGK